MKPSTTIYLLITAFAVFIVGSSCRSAFGPKSGCPANGKAVGAERILSGEKVPKARKFRA